MQISHNLKEHFVDLTFIHTHVYNGKKLIHKLFFFKIWFCKKCFKGKPSLLANFEPLGNGGSVQSFGDHKVSTFLHELVRGVVCGGRGGGRWGALTTHSSR